MDLWTVHVKSTHRSPFLLRNSIPEKPISWNSRKMASLQFVEGRTLEIRVSRRNVSSGYQSLVVRAMGKKNRDNTNSSSSSSSSSSGNGDQSIPGGDGTKGNDSSSESNKSNNDAASQNSHRKTLDWREFRAALYEKEQVETVVINARNVTRVFM